MSFVAVVDSGIGGLTVLKNLVENNPCGNFVYLGDHAFCPYGTKPARTVEDRVVCVCKYLKSVGANQIVLACNTASVFAASVRRAVGIPVFDVIYPTCVDVRKTTRSGKVALLATNVTVKCSTYAKILDTMGIESVSLACDEFVGLVEKDGASKQIVVENKLSELSGYRFDTVVLGCTHFPLLQNYIQNCFPRCNIVSCSNAVARYLSTSGSGCVVCYTTGNEKTATHAASQFGYTFEHVDF